MPVGAAALPLLIGGGVAAQGVGSVLGAKSAKAQNMPIPAPEALFPWANQQFGTNVVGAGQQGMRSLTSMAATGEPTHIGDVFSTMMDAQQRLLGQGRAGLREQFGGMGAYASTNFSNAAVDYETQVSKDFANILANLAMQSSEAAAGRKLAAGGQLTELFGNTAMAYRPTSTVVGGTPSPTGAGFSGIGNSLTTLALLQSAGLLGGGAGGGLRGTPPFVAR